MYRVLCAVLVVCCVAGCEATRIADIKPGEIPANDSDIGGIWYRMDKFEARLKNAPNRVQDTELTNYLSDLTCRITKEYCKDIRVYVMDYPYFNASMSPNGMMVVWTGLLLRAQNEDQLAFVLAHELGHFVKQHSIKRFRKLKNTDRVLMVLSFGLPQSIPLSGLGALGTILKFNRDQEREADAFAAKRLPRLNLNPEAGADAFALLQMEEEASEVPRRSVFFSTHPATEKRVETIRELAAKEKTLVDDKNTDDSSFQTIMQKFCSKWLKREVAKRDYAASEVLLKRLSKESASPQLVDFYLGELYRKRGEETDLASAVDYYEKHIDQTMPIADAYKALGDVYRKLGRSAEAINAYEQFLLRAPQAANRNSVQRTLNNLKEI